MAHNDAGTATAEDERRTVGLNEGRPAWSAAAFDVLVETAARYNALVVYSDLAVEVQRRTGLSTRQQQQNWVGKILADVVVRCREEGLPALTALVVRKDDGQVGVGYDMVLKAAGLEPIHDQLEREEHAAGARLECYRRWCADVPADAVPALSLRMQEAEGRRRRAARPVPVGDVCTVCFIQKPTSGRCQECEG